MTALTNYSDQHRWVASQLARADFYFFCRWMFLRRNRYNWQKADHHQILCDALMRVYNGDCQNLIINIPPRYSKTEIAVVNFMAWCLGQVPDCEFIHISYSARLAGNNSKACRELVTTDDYRAIFPDTILRNDSKAKDEWRTTDGGVVYATGSKGTITGYGAGKHRPGFAGCIIIDDPHKASEARSDNIRKEVLDNFVTTIKSRRNMPSQTPTIVIMQRLHENDLSGWLLAGGDGEHWEHVCLPALRDDGTALWEAKHSVEDLRLMQDASPYTFAGQYQQRPAAPDGNIFKPDRLVIVDALPAGCNWVRAWDFAASDDDGDYTVGLKFGVLPDGRFIIADIARFREGPEVVESNMLNTAKRDGNECRIRIPQDPGQAGKSQSRYFVNQLAGYTVIAKTVTGDKVTRAEPVASQMNVGNILMLKASWNDALIDELRNFPNGTNDDQVDALSDAFTESTQNTFGMIDYLQQQVAEMKARKQKAEGG